MMNIMINQIIVLFVMLSRVLINFATVGSFEPAGENISQGTKGELDENTNKV